MVFFDSLGSSVGKEIFSRPSPFPHKSTKRLFAPPRAKGRKLVANLWFRSSGKRKQARERKRAPPPPVSSSNISGGGGESSLTSPSALPQGTRRTVVFSTCLYISVFQEARERAVSFRRGISKTDQMLNERAQMLNFFLSFSFSFRSKKPECHPTGRL